MITHNNINDLQSKSLRVERPTLARRLHTVSDADGVILFSDLNPKSKRNCLSTTEFLCKTNTMSEVGKILVLSFPSESGRVTRLIPLNLTSLCGELMGRVCVTPFPGYVEKDRWQERRSASEERVKMCEYHHRSLRYEESLYKAT